ncbi:hypothetical protein CYMTET_50982 [Cymbomonas tetramitiformis]|uniref:Receptor ligand binding region domain-containing protein n=1 Tax=Cymbomonas tetramitiformis TaxID=36881 RepID=A0AAE0ES98_9CHLO|nr:hypothetical protein CYMTET_50982 [Cymbomonas tetramitiformis]
MARTASLSVDQIARGANASRQGHNNYFFPRSAPSKKLHRSGEEPFCSRARQRLLSSERETAGLTLCIDNEVDWRDIDGDTCLAYEELDWCTASGEPGPGLGTNASLEDYADADGLNAGEVCCACGAGEDIFRLGVALGLYTSNGFAFDGDTFSGASLAAIHLALQELNGNDRVLAGRRVEFMVVDSKCHAETGYQAAISLDTWGADAVVGTTCSNSAVAAQTVLGNIGIPEISGGATMTLVPNTGNHTYFMRTVPSAEQEAQAVADVVHYYNWSSVVTVSAADSYGETATGKFDKAAEDLNISVANRLTYKLGVEDFSEVVRGLQESHSHIIVTFGYAVDIGRLMEQAYAAGVGGEGFVWVGGADTAQPKLWEGMSSNVSESERNAIMQGYLGVRGYINTSTPEYVAFAERWRAQPATMDPVTGWCSSAMDDAGAPIYQRYDVDDNLTSYDACVGMVFNTTEEIPPYVAYWYDAVYVVAYALQMLLAGAEGGGSGDITRQELRDAMLAQSFVGVSGTLSFHADGNRSSGLMHEVVNHNGNSALQRVALWAPQGEVLECDVLREGPGLNVECGSVVWSTANNQRPKSTYITLGNALALTTMEGEADDVTGLAAVLMALQDIEGDDTVLANIAVRLAVTDSKCESLHGKEASVTLLEMGADVIVGSTCTTASAAMATRLDVEEIPQISGSATGAELGATDVDSDEAGESDPYPYLMRTIPSDAFQASALADLVHFYNWTRVATVAGEDSYGLSGIEAFQEAAEALDITIRQQDRLTYEIGVEDFSEVVRGLQESRALIIVTFGHALDTGRLMEQAYAAGVAGKGTCGWK